MPKSKTSLNELLYDIRRIEGHREVLTEKKIKAIYRSLEKDLNNFLAEQYVKYADPDGRLYVSTLEATQKKAWFLNEIVKNVDNMTPALEQELSALVDKTYSECYKGMVKAVQKADTAEKLAKVTKDISVRPEVLKQAVNNNISKLTLPRVLERNRADIIYQIQQELNISLMNGNRYEQTAKNISKRVGVSEGKALNIARTETHRNIENGFMDSAERLSEKLEGSDLIYAATWCTMGDERVRPQVRYKTKSGWKTKINKNGANHIKMNGVTIKVGEKFKLESGVYAKNPSNSGVARHDCNCRCFLEYNLMTPEEFAKATGKKIESVQPKKQIEPEKVKLQLSDYPEAMTKGAEGKNTQKLIDYVNGIEGADPKALKLYSSMGKLENFTDNGIPFKISHAKSHSIATSSNRYSGDLVEVKMTIPKLKGDNLAGQVNTTLHEQMHLIDLYGREDVKKNGKWFSVRNKPLVDTFKNTSADIGDDIAELFVKHNDECKAIRKAAQKSYDDAARATKEKYLPNGMSPWENISGYRQYEKEAKKLYKEMVEDIDYQSRNIMGGGVNNLQDIYDALSAGKYRADGTVIYGHGQQYYAYESHQIKETIANYASLSVTRPDLIDLLRKDKPELCNALDNVIEELIEKAGG